jgi:hypothetical protein
VQAVYAALKNESNSDVEYLLGNLPGLTEEALEGMPLPDGVTAKEYRAALTADVIGTARKLVAACRVSGQRREDFELTIREGNEAGSWTDSEGNPFSLPVLQLLRDCEIRWSSTFLLLNRVLMLLPVCIPVATREHILICFIGDQCICFASKASRERVIITCAQQSECLRCRAYS